MRKVGRRRGLWQSLLLLEVVRVRVLVLAVLLLCEPRPVLRVRRVRRSDDLRRRRMALLRDDDALHARRGQVLPCTVDLHGAVHPLRPSLRRERSWSSSRRSCSGSGRCSSSSRSRSSAWRRALPHEHLSGRALPRLGVAVARRRGLWLLARRMRRVGTVREHLRRRASEARRRRSSSVLVRQHSRSTALPAHLARSDEQEPANTRGVAGNAFAQTHCPISQRLEQLYSPARFVLDFSRSRCLDPRTGRKEQPARRTAHLRAQQPRP